MKKIGCMVILWLACLAAIHGSTQAQTNVVTAAHFNCIVYNATTCPAALENYSGLATLAIVAGYATPGDGGGGQYVTGMSCLDFPNLTSPLTPAGAFATGHSTVDGVINASGAVVGSIINAPGFVPAGTEIAALPSGQIVMTEPAMQSTPMGSTTNFTITGSNGGTVIRATTTATQLCFYKTDYRGDPHEFAAVGDGVADDTVPLQNWLGAYGMVTNPAATSAPSNFGPWIATIPANYLVTGPLTCPPNANIQAPANLTGSPAVRIFTKSFAASLHPYVNTNEPGLMVASDYCRLSGIALDATQIGNFYLATTGTPQNGSNQLTNVASVANVYPGMPIGDNNVSIPNGTYVTSTIPSPCCKINISQPASCTMCGSENIFITGLDTFDITGTHVSIDSRTLLTGGYANVRCGNPSPFQVGLQIKDSEIIGGTDEGIHLGGCSNIRLVGDLISENGTGGTGFESSPVAGIPPDGNGVSFGGQELTVSDGVIEQSGGIGLNLRSAQLVSVTGMYFDNNGKRIGGAAMQIAGSQHVTVTGNHIHRSGGFVPGSTTSQIYLSGTSDDIALAANAYYADAYPSDATLKPSYVYDAGMGTLLTNSHLYEQPPPQAAGAVYSSTAAPILTALQVPQFTNEITGLTLSNGGLSVVNIAAGSAADSTAAALMKWPPGPACTVDITHVGVGGVDVMPSSYAGTYNYFLISSAGGSPTTNCIASQSLAPSFANTGTAFALSTTAQASVGGTTLYNVPTVAGVKIGDLVAGSFIAAGTTVTAVSTMTTYQAVTPYTGGGSGCNTGSPYNCFNASTTGLFTGMGVSDNGANQSANSACASLSGPAGQNAISNYTSIVAVLPGLSAGVIEVSPSVSASSDCFTLSGGNTMTISPGTSAAANSPTAITIFTGLYRMVGALYANNSAAVVPFIQDSDTFYLSEPVAVSPALNTSAQTISLAVPTGIPVEALGRCIGSGGSGTVYVYLYNPFVNPAVTLPGNFPSVPGYSVKIVSPSTSTIASVPSFPFQLYTNTSAQIYGLASSSSGSPTANCMTDGWVWHRAQ